MKRILSVIIVISLFLLMLSGCQSKSDQVYSQAINQASDIDSAAPTSDPESETSQGPDTSPSDSLTGTLTIKTRFPLGDVSAVPYLAKEFMDLHPNVTIEIETGSDSNAMSRQERAMVTESFYADVSMEIASGEADYLLFNVRDRLNIPQLTRNGFLTDLWPYWNADPDIDPDEYFTGVLDGFTVDGKLTSLPFSFYFYMLYLNGDILDELNVDRNSIKAVDAYQILDWYEQARETHDDLNLGYCSPGKDLLLYCPERYRYIDLNARTASFDTPECIEFLNRTNRVLNEDPDLDPALIGWGSYGAFMDANISYEKTGAYSHDLVEPPDVAPESIVEHTRPGFLALDASQPASLTTMQHPMEYAAGPYPLVTTEGKLGIASLEEFYMPASMKEKDLAWEFMKYCIKARGTDELGFREQGTGAIYTTYLPLTKRTLQSVMENYGENAYSGLTVGAYGHFDTIDPQLMIQQLDEILDLEMFNMNLYSVDIDEFSEEFYVNGLTTAEQFAKKLQDRAYIWLNE